MKIGTSIPLHSATLHSEELTCLSSFIFHGTQAIRNVFTWVLSVLGVDAPRVEPLKILKTLFGEPSPLRSEDSPNKVFNISNGSTLPPTLSQVSQNNTTKKTTFNEATPKLWRYKLIGKASPPSNSQRENNNKPVTAAATLRTAPN